MNSDAYWRVTYWFIHAKNAVSHLRGRETLTLARIVAGCVSDKPMPRRLRNTGVNVRSYIMNLKRIRDLRIERIRDKSILRVCENEIFL